VVADQIRNRSNSIRYDSLKNKRHRFSRVEFCRRAGAEYLYSEKRGAVFPKITSPVCAASLRRVFPREEQRSGRFQRPLFSAAAQRAFRDNAWHRRREERRSGRNKPFSFPLA